MSKRLLLPVLCTLAAASLPLRAQNLVPNGDFRSTTAADDLWDGVDGDGNLAGATRTMTALNDLNRVTDVAIPVSVSVGDMNGDGLPDLVTADPNGYFRIYFNSGTAQQPKFTHAEMVPIYFARPISPPGSAREDHLSLAAETLFRGPRIDLYDMTGRGALDIVAGLYAGDMMLIPNAGSKVAPNFRQPGDVFSLLFPTSAQKLRWANLLSPAVVDWDRDGKPDILAGDGSYSANSVFLLKNEGSGAQPKFSEEGRSYLVYGNGRTQLCPTVADYNGDGLPDVIAVDRTGQVTVNLNQTGLAPGAPLTNSSVISFGAAASIRSTATVKAADLNGDGLFDLVFGKGNGRLAVAYNKGTKEQPQFGAVEDLKGEDVWKRDILIPSGWTCDTGFGKGNIYGKMSVVNNATDPDSQPPSGKNCLRLSYDQPMNKIIPMVPVNTKPAESKMAFFFSPRWGLDPVRVELANIDLPVSSMLLEATFDKIEPNKPYALSFGYKGRNFTGEYAVGMRARGQVSARKITRGDRGSATSSADELRDFDLQQGNFSPATQWTSATRTVTFHFKVNELNDPAKWKGAAPISFRGVLYIRVDLQPYQGVCYIDNVQLTPK